MTSVPNLLQQLSGNNRRILWLCLAAVMGFSSCSRTIFTGKSDREKEREKDTGVVTEPEVEKRSEEHTSELQSLMRISYAVFCLTKKKNNTALPPTLTNKR